MGGPDATSDRWKQSSSAVRVSGGYPGNDTVIPVSMLLGHLQVQYWQQNYLAADVFNYMFAAQTSSEMTKHFGKVLDYER